MPPETVLRSPRLALAAAAEVPARLAAGALADLLGAWQVPLILFADGADEAPERPWGRLRRIPLGELEELAEAGLDPVADRWATANGGDVTLLAAAASDRRLPRLAAATATPLVVIVGRDDPAARAAALRAEVEGEPGVEVAGFLVLADPPAGAEGIDLPEEVDGLRCFGWISTAVADAPEAAEPIAALEQAAAADPEPAGLDLRALLLAGDAAPALASSDGSGVASAAANGRPARRPRPPRGRALMIQGTHSSAGKSFIATALARYFSDRGLRVAPFKGQNMSNNSRVAEGGEIGVAQYMQALAGRAEPDVRMNPVLLKPHDRGSQVVMLGRPDLALSALPWRLRKPVMWPVVRGALDDLLAEHDLVLIEGAGSPAEPYMYLNDIVNMRVAREFGAPVLLIADAGRGGAIAQAYGTWRLLPEPDRRQIGAFLFNRFYPGGYTDLFLPGCAQLEHLTGVPSLGILPELETTLPDEDLHSLSPSKSGQGRRVAVLAYPRISNFDEFAALERAPDLDLAWVKDVGALADADLLILPGSKNVPLDLAWMRDHGFDSAVREWAAAGKPLLGICGGLQMLGERIEDPVGVEGEAEGLGILPLTTIHGNDKVQSRTRATFADTAALAEPWQRLGGIDVDAYQIRFGRTEANGEVTAILPDGTGFARDNVVAISLHGIFENRAVARAVLGLDLDAGAELDRLFDAAAAALAAHLDVALLEELALG
jgi:adenosylcobyric acid synthase